MTSRENPSAVARGDPGPGGSARYGVGHAVLLIDDDESALTAWRLRLAHDGFAVDQARSGAVGLALASQAIYDVVVLALSLPDMAGLTPLTTLRARGVDTPVLVVTRFATHESTAQAFRLGAADVLEKPVGDELVAAVRRLVQQRRSSEHAATRQRVGMEPLPGPGAPHGVLDRVAQVRQTMPGTADGDRAASGDQTSGDVPARHACETFVAALVAAFIRPEIHVRAFLPGAHALREAIAASDAPTLSHRAGHIVRQFAWALEDHGPLPPATIVKAIATIEQAVRAGQNPIHERDVARDLGLHPAHLGRLLKLHIGAGFRPLRRIFRARRALLLVVNSEEQFAQIAYVVGYAHASQLDRDFHHLFGARPGWIRRCMRVSSTIRK